MKTSDNYYNEVETVSNCITCNNDIKEGEEAFEVEHGQYICRQCRVNMQHEAKHDMKCDICGDDIFGASSKFDGMTYVEHDSNYICFDCVCDMTKEVERGDNG